MSKAFASTFWARVSNKYSPTFLFLPIFNVKILNKISNPTKILIIYMIANICFSLNHLIKINLGLANSISFDSIIVAIIVYGSRDSMDLALRITLGVVVVQNKTQTACNLTSNYESEKDKN
jgi:hypothetical protein